MDALRLPCAEPRRSAPKAGDRAGDRRLPRALALDPDYLPAHIGMARAKPAGRATSSRYLAPFPRGAAAPRLSRDRRRRRPHALPRQAADARDRGRSDAEGRPHVRGDDDALRPRKQRRSSSPAKPSGRSRARPSISRSSTACISSSRPCATSSTSSATRAPAASWSFPRLPSADGSDRDPRPRDRLLDRRRLEDRPDPAALRPDLLGLLVPAYPTGLLVVTRPRPPLARPRRESRRGDRRVDVQRVD